MRASVGVDNTGVSGPRTRVTRPVAGVVVVANGPGSAGLAERLATAGYLPITTCCPTDPGRSGRFGPADIAALARYLVVATDRAARLRTPVGLLAGDVAAAAALVTAVERTAVRAVVSYGGRPELAGATLADVTVPVLLVVGGLDGPALAANRQVLAVLGAPSRMVVVPTAEHWFTQPDEVRLVAGHAVAWYRQHLTPRW
jgi:putative phosphoribosyl transferase